MGKRELLRSSLNKFVHWFFRIDLPGNSQDDSTEKSSGKKQVISWPGRVASRVCLVASAVFLVLLLIPIGGSLIVHKDDGHESYGPYRGAVVSRSQYVMDHFPDYEDGDNEVPADAQTIWPGTSNVTIAISYGLRGGVDVWDGSSNLLASYPDFGSELGDSGQPYLLDLVVDPNAKLLYVLDQYGPKIGIYSLTDTWVPPVFVGSYKLPSQCGIPLRGMYVSKDGTSLTLVDTSSQPNYLDDAVPHQNGDVIGCRIDAKTGALGSVMRWSDPSASVILATTYDSQTGDLFFLSSTNDWQLPKNNLPDMEPGYNFLSVLRSDATTVENYPVPSDSSNRCPCENGATNLVVDHIDNNVYVLMGHGVYRYPLDNSTSAPVKMWQETNSHWQPVALVSGNGGWWIAESNDDGERCIFYSDKFKQLVHPIKVDTDATTFIPLWHGLAIGTAASACVDCTMSAVAGFYSSDMVIDLQASRPFDELWSWTYFWLFFGLAIAGMVIFRGTLRYERTTAIFHRQNREAARRWKHNRTNPPPILLGKQADASAGPMSGQIGGQDGPPSGFVREEPPSDSRHPARNGVESQDPSLS